jgi:hypothetical protein
MRLTGPGWRQSLNRVEELLATGARPSGHLHAEMRHPFVLLDIYVDVLFLDLEHAAHAAGLFDRAVTLEWVRRGKDANRGSDLFKFDSAALMAAFEAQGHCA